MRNRLGQHPNIYHQSRHVQNVSYMMIGMYVQDGPDIYSNAILVQLETVARYVGETGKNIEKVFTEAQGTGSNKQQA